MKAFRITPKDIKRWKSSLHAFEQHFTYPLGDDSFSIDHGENYLAFFERIGNAHLFAMEEDGKLIAVGAGVIHRRLKCWYLCDMKVHPEHRGRKLPLKLFRRYFLPCYLKSQRGFALNMENANGKKNPIAKIMENLPWTPLKKGARVLFYYEEASNTERAMIALARQRPGMHFSSLQGTKELILKSTGKAIPLLHMEWGKKTAGQYAKPQAEHLHMWCLDEKDELNQDLAASGIIPKASGLIFHHRLSHLNWSELRTSEL